MKTQNINRETYKTENTYDERKNWNCDCHTNGINRRNECSTAL